MHDIILSPYQKLSFGPLKFISLDLQKKEKKKYSKEKNGYEQVHLGQGNLKGESVVSAILPLRMEVSYCTSRFFRS